MVSWVGGNRSPKTDFVVEPKEIKINSKGFRVQEYNQDITRLNLNNIAPGDIEASQSGQSGHSNRVKRQSNEKLEVGECAVIPEWEAQQRDENREFRTQRKQRNKKCFPFSICS